MPEHITHPDNEQLIQAVREFGDTTAFQELYDRYASMVTGFAYKIVGNRDLAEEITQETFWRVWKNAASYNGSLGNFTGWLFGIARNLAIDSLRRNKKVVIHSFHDEAHQTEISHALNGHHQHDLADIADGLVNRDHVHTAMEELPPDQRNVVVWIYFQGKTRREIAAEYGIPFGTINTRAKLALKKLRHILACQGIEA